MQVIIIHYIQYSNFPAIDQRIAHKVSTPTIIEALRYKPVSTEKYASQEVENLQDALAKCTLLNNHFKL